MEAVRSQRSAEERRLRNVCQALGYARLDGYSAFTPETLRLYLSYEVEDPQMLGYSEKYLLKALTEEVGGVANVAWRISNRSRWRQARSVTVRVHVDLSFVENTQE